MDSEPLKKSNCNAKPACGNVIPVKELAFPTVGKANVETPAARDGLVLDDADAVGHESIDAIVRQLRWDAHLG